MNTTKNLKARSIEETIQMAGASLAAGDYETTQRVLRAGLDQYPQSADLMLLLGHSYLERKDFERGLECYDNVAALHPNLAPVESSRALALQLLGRSADAENAAHRALHLNSIDEIALKVLVRIHLNKGQGFVARPLCERLLALNSKDEQARQMMAECEKVCRQAADETLNAQTKSKPLQQTKPEANWKDEIDFWDKELSLTGQFVEDMTKRVHEPEKVFPLEVIPYIKELRQKRGKIPRVLDAGSGPLPYLSYGHQSGMMDLVGADPLADVYFQLLAKHGRKPTAPLVKCGGEELTRMFGAEAFDFIYMRNALDHSQSPGEVFCQMVRALRPGGYIYILGTVKEATRQNWAGLHQHNLFLEAGGRLMDEQKSRDGELVIDCISDGYGLEMVNSSPPCAESGGWLSVIWRKPEPARSAQIA